jgi:hypothetical protein
MNPISNATVNNYSPLSLINSQQANNIDGNAFVQKSTVASLPWGSKPQNPRFVDWRGNAPDPSKWNIPADTFVIYATEGVSSGLIANRKNEAGEVIGGRQMSVDEVIRDAKYEMQSSGGKYKRLVFLTDSGGLGREPKFMNAIAKALNIRVIAANSTVLYGTTDQNGKIEVSILGTPRGQKPGFLQYHPSGGKPDFRECGEGSSFSDCTFTYPADTDRKK